MCRTCKAIRVLFVVLTLGGESSSTDKTAVVQIRNEKDSRGLNLALAQGQILALA